jgi:hypothetical protein
MIKYDSQHADKERSKNPRRELDQPVPNLEDIYDNQEIHNLKTKSNLLESNQIPSKPFV